MYSYIVYRHYGSNIHNKYQADREMYKWSDQLLPKGKVAFTPFED